MPDKSTYIKLDRNIKDWSCFTDSKALQLWIFLLTSAVYEPTEYRGVKLRRGQWATSLRQIENATGQDRRTLKGSLEKLIESGSVTVESRHKKYMVIGVTNYDLYQSGARKENKKENKKDEEITKKDESSQEDIVWDKERREWVYADG